MKHERKRPAMYGAGSGRLAARVGLALCMALPLAGCIGYEGTIQRGYVADARTVDGLRPGTSKEQILSQLGTPSTTSTIGGDAWYYISQRVEKPVAFMPEKITDQRVLAVYFGRGKLERVANYGLKDGQLFDYVTRTTPVAGGDASFVQNMIRGLLKFS